MQPSDRPPVRELPFGADCYAVNLQIQPPPDTRSALDGLRQSMAESTGLAMLFAPAETLHLTAFSIVYVRAVYATTPETVWAKLERPVIEALERCSQSMAPFALTFDRAGLRGDAVIVQADPDPRLEAIRDAVEAAIADRAPVFRTESTHTTVGRLPEPSATTWTRPLSSWQASATLLWPVDDVRLVLERRYPALDETEILRFPLTGG